MFIGPKQTILSNASGATVTTHIIGATDNVLTTDKGRPIVATAGAVGILLRAYCTTGSPTGTIAPGATSPFYVCWDGLTAASSAISTQALGTALSPTSAVAVTANPLTAINFRAFENWTNAITATIPFAPCILYPSLYLRIVVATATIDNLTIEARCVYMGNGSQYLTLDPSAAPASFSW